MQYNQMHARTDQGCLSSPKETSCGMLHDLAKGTVCFTGATIAERHTDAYKNYRGWCRRSRVKAVIQNKFTKKVWGVSGFKRKRVTQHVAKAAALKTCIGSPTCAGGGHSGHDHSDFGSSRGQGRLQGEGGPAQAARGRQHGDPREFAAAACPGGRLPAGGWRQREGSPPRAWRRQWRRPAADASGAAPGVRRGGRPVR